MQFTRLRVVSLSILSLFSLLRTVPRLFQPDVPFLDLGSDDLRDNGFNLDYSSNTQGPRTTDTDRALATLEFMKQNFPRFSLKSFIQELFTSGDPSIKNVTNSYLGTGGAMHILNTVIGDKGMKEPDIDHWIMEQATLICTKEGKYYEEAKFLRVPAHSVNVQILQSFSVPGLLQVYEKTTSHLQKFLKAVIGKDSPPPGADDSTGRCQHNPDMCSRKKNLHGAMNSLMLWDGRVPKRLVQTLNRYGFCTSYLYQTKAVENVSKDSVRLASQAANDPEKLPLFPYDNFNWMEKAWETSATHGSISHDQVSALLVMFRLPQGLAPTEAAHLASVDNFEQTARTRHQIPPEQSLEDILPSALDQDTFADNAMKQVAHILVEEVAGFKSHLNSLALFFDPHALSTNIKDEEHFLPTYDQEQGSTRGNMLVLEHYFRDVFRIPKTVFENQNFFVLGDRLTTARDRAAQDQRAVDRSEDRFDHLSSFETLSGLMHFVMNQIQNMGKNAWGGANKDSLPNRSNINLRKIDFYAWLRFLDVILRALVLRVAMVILKVSSPEQLQQHTLSSSAFKSLCSYIVVEFLLPSPDRLEADGIKTLSGSAESGNAVLLMHDLMTVREMHHAIKHGYPERVERMLKYWSPMFYAGGGSNYANESMELLHNLNHDWPKDISPILRGGMLINNQAKPAKFKETDIRVEQFNKTIKSHAHGANVRPGLLEKITPAIGHIQELTEQIFEDLGVEDEDQHHAKVRQHKDVGLLLDHLCTSKIFDFQHDKASNHTVVDLYRTGLHQLAGPDGGHARHLHRHYLRSRVRHENQMPPDSTSTPDNTSIHSETSTYEDDLEELQKLDRELALDNERPKFTLLEQLDDQAMRWGIDYSDNNNSFV
ncbi:hypothetical protein DFH07DRAFT_782810 [Mycena maculata]|uniref:DUF6589 domain-containing protein n=1 Tax=Mycena maculata TaxID=230809 RepID=A0AAD7MP91_9AGAR|nr:hypothetical protein DFH07DRAFT_782810 [Mycena maculata]